MSKARASARTLAALSDIKGDRYRLNRFNAEQREQLDKRLTAAEERLPQQVVQAYRHLLLLGESDTGGVKLDHIDLGPARVDAKVGARVVEYLRGADRLVESTLAPAALLANRFGLLPEGTDAVELDQLLGYFARLPRLPKLAGPQVLRAALVEGVAKGLFGMSSGSAWDADDAVLRFAQRVDPSEVQFQPGTFLVRAAAIKELLADRKGTGPQADEAPGQPEAGPDASAGPDSAEGAAARGGKLPAPAAAISSITLTVKGIPGSKARDVVKVAVLPLSAHSTEVTMDVIIQAEGGLAGIPRETIELVVLEGLRQRGLTDVQLEDRSK
ncbi:MAG: hypothetical protein M3Q23_18290 [Actinomycetota bacterium]|nr:hypothetical protein [Actinomycetota bacterium]